MFFRPRLQCALAAFSGLFLAASGHAQANSQVHTTAHPAVRVTQKIDNAVLAALPGTHPQIVEHAVIGARLQASKPLSHMMLVLDPSDDQTYAMRSLLDQQQDKTSPNYHKWLTPDAYAQYFGVASADLAKITAWLQDQGFTVNSVAKGNRIVTFSGTVGQVESTFHTQMKRVTVNGEAHIANTTDIQVPQAFAGVIHGIASLNDFFPKTDAVGARKVEFNSTTPAGKAQALGANAAANPLYTSTTSGAHYVTPGDAAVIFNSTPLLKSGVDGTGQTIAVLGRTNITLSDVQQFRSMFGLKKNDPTFTVIGNDPGLNADDIEAYLDVEWAGGMAPGASVNFIVGGTDYETTGGISNAGLYAVDNNLADIITLSYGGCETGNGASGTAFWNTLWEQAAAQGQTVFISSGDSNATGCQSSSATYGTAYGVNALGSGAYNVAVGGSMFVDYNPNLYWTPGASAPVPAGYNFTTATGYIPEAVWNQGSLSTTYLNTLSTGLATGSGIVGGGGGLSIYTPRPSWQTGSGISATADATCSSGTCIAANTTGFTTHRMVPDISFIAASGHAATVFCGESSCFNTSTSYGIGAVGGTSVATPVMASVQALINQVNGGRQGNANFHYYPLANADYIAGNCKAVNGTASNPTVTLPAASCNFHDIVAGDNRSKANATDTTGLGFYAGTGFDAASGLGSVNINNVTNNWKSVSFLATSTSFALFPATLATHGGSQNFTIGVSANTGIPSGDVSIIAVTTNPGAPHVFTLSGGGYSGTLTGLPGGTYNIYAHYEGDGTYAASDSPSIHVNIGKEPSTVTLNLYDFYPGIVQSGVTSLPYGYLADLIGTVAGASATGTPSGTLAFAISQNGTTLAPYTGTLDASGNAALIAGAGYSSLYIAPNYPALAPGSYTVTASYAGDSSFNASTGTSNFTVTKYTSTGTLTSSSAYITSGTSVTLNYSIARIALTPSNAAFPTGTVTFTDTTTGAVLGSSSLNSAGVAALSTPGITASGVNAITATYSGDTFYAPLTSAALNVTVGTLTSTSTSVSVTGTYSVLSVTPIVATISPAMVGTVYFYDGATLLGSATSNTAGVAIFSSSTLTAGTHFVLATFSGTSTYASSTGGAQVTLAQNITTTLLDAPVNSTVGQTVAFNARVARSPAQSSAGTVLLTGTVNFYDGANVIATGTPVYLPGGYYYYVAQASTAALTRGVHTIRAVYTGDSNFATSSSATIALTVTPDNVWVANASGSVSSLTSTGTMNSTTSGGGTGIAIDNSGNVWSLQAGASSVTKLSSTGTVLNSGFTGAGITSPTALAIDGAGMVWIANSNSTVSVLSSSGAAISPASGYPAPTSIPSSLSIDASGNLWITSAGDSSLTEVVGAAAPVTTPLTNAVTNNNLATKP